MPTWPLNPVHITKDGKKRLEYECLDDVGIISNDHLQGIQTVITAKLKIPTTIVEFPTDKSIQPVRTDSEVLNIVLRPACKYFRNCTNHQFCLDADSAIAQLFRDLLRSQIPWEVNKRIKESAYIREFFNEPGISRPHLEKIDDRPYVVYDCPMLGFRETAFPIFFENRVIAVFFLGQFCLMEKISESEYFQTNFFNRYHRQIENSIKKHQSQIDLQGFRDQLKKETSNQYENYSINFDKFTLLLHDCCKELFDLENTLMSSMEKNRERAVQKRMVPIVTSFRNSLPKTFPIKDAKFNFFWDVLTNSITEILNKFGMDFILVFYADEKNNGYCNNNELCVYRQIGLLPRDVNSRNIIFKCQDLPEDILKYPGTTVKGEELEERIAGMEGVVNKDRDIARVFFMPFSDHMEMVIYE